MPLREVSDDHPSSLEASSVSYPASLGLPHTLVEWLTMLIVACDGDRRCIRRVQARPAADMITSRACMQGRKWVTRIRAAHGCNLFTMTAYTGESAKGCCSPAFS